MTEEQIMKYIDIAVEKTVTELYRRGALKDMDDVKYANISYMLTDYYQNGQAVQKIEMILDKLKGDEYFEIIPMYYGDGLNIADIAKVRGCDISTIVRNKKRLCLQIYTLLI